CQVRRSFHNNRKRDFHRKWEHWLLPGFRCNIAGPYPLRLKPLPAFTPPKPRLESQKYTKNQGSKSRCCAPTHQAEAVFASFEALAPVDIRAEMTLGDGLSARPLKN